MPTIYELYESVLRESEYARVNEVALRALICDIQGYSEMSDFYLRKDAKVVDLPLFLAHLARFLNGEPYQYIIQRATFLNHDFFVDSRVLIPRMETEEVVKQAISIINERHDSRAITIADVATGSGVIGISLKRAFPNAKVYASDISEEALKVADINIRKHNVDISILQGDVLEPFLFSGIKIDVLVANPPYITNLQEIAPDVIKYEPYLALVDHEELGFYRKVFQMYKAVCNYPFIMLFEIGHDMRGKIETLANSMIPRSQREIIKDINGKDRILSIYIEGE